MACNFTPRGSNTSLNENEMKAYLLDGGLRKFIDSGDVKVADIENFFKQESIRQAQESREGGRYREGGVYSTVSQDPEINPALAEKLARIDERTGGQAVRYKQASQEEANEIAQAVIRQYGVAGALDYARAKDGVLNEDVRSLIYANVLTDSSKKINKLNAEGKYLEAMEEAEFYGGILLEYTNEARGAGRFTSATRVFYEQNNLGFAAAIKQAEDKRIEDNVFNPNKATFQELIAELESQKEFAPYLNEKVRAAMEKSKPNQKVKSVKKKIFDFLDSLKVKDNEVVEIDGRQVTVKKNTVVPPDVFNKGIDLIKSLIEKGYAIADAVKEGIAEMQKAMGGAQDLSEYEQRIREELSDMVSEIEDAEWKKLSARLMPKDVTKQESIRTDISKINAYLSRQNNAERGVMLAAMLTRMNEIGAITDEQLANGVPTEEALAELIGKMTDDQKKLISEFLSGRIQDAKTESAKQNAIARVEKFLEKRLKEINDLIEGGEVVTREPKTELTSDRITELKEEIKQKEAELAQARPELAQDKAEKKRIKQLENQIKDMREFLATGRRVVRQKVEYTSEEVKRLENLRDSLQELVDKKLEDMGVTFEKKVKMATRLAENYIAEYEALIATRQIKERRTKQNYLSQELQDRKDAVKAEYEKMQDEIIASTRPDQMPDWFKQNVINKYLKKIEKMTEEQKQTLMKRSMLEIISNGGLQEEQFKKILSDVMGKKPLSSQEIAYIEDLTAKINQEAIALKTLSEASAVMEANPTAENERQLVDAFNDFEKTRKVANTSRHNLNEKLYRKPNLAYKLASMLQLNTLNAVSIIKNLSYNVWDFIPKVFNDIVRTAGEEGAYLVSLGANKTLGWDIYHPTFSLLRSGTVYWKYLYRGLQEGWFTTKTGQQRVDYFDDQLLQSRFRPGRGYKHLLSYAVGGVSKAINKFDGKEDMWSYAEKLSKSDIAALAYIGRKVNAVLDMSMEEMYDKNFTLTEYADMAIDMSSGIHAEAIARLLTLFDKPFRYGAEGAKAVTLAKTIFGITNKTELEVFVQMPYEEARRRYYNKIKLEGKITNEDEILQLADDKARAIEKQITLAGDKAVFTQSNLIADAWEGMQKSLRAQDSAWSDVAMLAAKAVSPFVRIPTNVAWLVVNYSNPALAFVQSAGFVGQYLRKKKNGTLTEVDKAVLTENAKKWAVVGTVGMILTPIINSLLPAMTGGDDDDDAEKERKAKASGAPPNSLNFSMIGRMLRGDFSNIHKGIDEDLYIDVTWFGSIGMMLGIRKELADNAKRMALEDKTPNIINNLSTHFLYVLTNGGFEGQFALAEGLKKGGMSSDGAFYSGLGIMNMALNVVQPGTYAKFSRDILDYNYRVADDSYTEALLNSYMARDAVARSLFDYKMPEKVTVWGLPAERKEGVLDKVKWSFGIDKGIKNNFAPTLMSWYNSSLDRRLLPPAVDDEYTYNGQTIKLSRDMHDAFQEYVGQYRLGFMNALFGGAVPEGTFTKAKTDSDVYKKKTQKLGQLSEKFFDMPYDQKIEMLDKVYSMGRDWGKAMFLSEYGKDLYELAAKNKMTEQKVSEMLDAMSATYVERLKKEGK